MWCAVVVLVWCMCWVWIVGVKMRRREVATVGRSDGDGGAADARTVVIRPGRRMCGSVGMVAIGTTRRRQHETKQLSKAEGIRPGLALEVEVQMFCYGYRGFGVGEGRGGTSVKARAGLAGLARPGRRDGSVGGRCLGTITTEIRLGATGPEEWCCFSQAGGMGWLKDVVSGFWRRTHDGGVCSQVGRGRSLVVVVVDGGGRAGLVRSYCLGHEEGYG